MNPAGSDAISVPAAYAADSTPADAFERSSSSA
jgi:hypothetical protein